MVKRRYLFGQLIELTHLIVDHLDELGDLLGGTDDLLAVNRRVIHGPLRAEARSQCGRRQPGEECRAGLFFIDLLFLNPQQLGGGLKGHAIVQPLLRQTHRIKPNVSGPVSSTLLRDVEPVLLLDRVLFPLS